MVCCTKQDIAIAWVATTSLSVAFVLLLTWAWAYETNWKLALFISTLYSIFLFFAAGLLELKYKKGDAEQYEKGSIFKLVSILVALGIIFIGIGGLTVAFNLYHCPSGAESYDYDYTVDTIYYTDSSTFPPDVKDWYAGGSYNGTQNSFASLLSLTIFSGKYDTNENRVWEIGTDDEKPHLFSNLTHPSEFTVVSNDTVCFLAYLEKERVVACTDGDSLLTTTGKLGNPHNLFASNRKLWFWEHFPLSWRHDMVVSLDPRTMEYRNHTQMRKNIMVDDVKTPTCDYSAVVHDQAVSSIIFSTVPVIALSLYIWAKYAVPTMPITAYFGVTFLFYTIKDLLSLPISSESWYSISCGLWFYCLFLFYLTNRVRQETLLWSLNFSGPLFGVINLYSLSTRASWIPWMCINVIGILPMIYIGIVTQFRILVIFGCLGILLDIFKVTFLISGMFSKISSVALDASIFILFGLFFFFIGGVINNHGKHIQDSAKDWAKRWLSCMMRCTDETELNVTEDTEQNLDSTMIDAQVITGLELVDNSRPIT